jgi:hypothetical protein
VQEEMKKVGILVLVIVLALGTLGVGYAMWYDTVQVVTTVHTGTLSVAIVDQKSNDPPPHGTAAGGGWFTGSLDPAGPHVPLPGGGGWLLFARNSPPTPSSGWSWSGTRYPKNVASANCTFTEDTLTITIDNAYPSYGPDIAFAIQNTGNIPVKVYSIKLTSVTTPQGTFPMNVDVDSDLANGLSFLVGNDGSVTPHYGPYPDGFDDNYAFTIVLSSTPGSIPMLGAQIEPGMGLAGDVGIHVAQDAVQGAQYSFTIVFTFANWNE